LPPHASNVLKNVDRMSRQERAQIQERAGHLRDEQGIGPIDR
jgi:hypothetical protein